MPTNGVLAKDLWKCTTNSNLYEFDGVSWNITLFIEYPIFKLLGKFDNLGNPLNVYN